MWWSVMIKTVHHPYSISIHSSNKYEVSKYSAYYSVEDGVGTVRKRGFTMCRSVMIWNLKSFICQCSLG
jgi:hypothetical protein